MQKASLTCQLTLFNLGVKHPLKPVNMVEVHSSLNKILQKYECLFSNDILGCLQGQRINLSIEKNMQPRFWKAWPVPYILKAKVGEELDRLKRLGIISPNQHAEWVAPIVPVVKRDGSVHICGDYKVTINQAINVDSYPLPRVDELFSDLSQGKYFSKLDKSNTYLQLPLYNRRCTEVSSNQYLSWIVEVPSPTLWCVSSACHFPEVYGDNLERDTRYCRVFR